MEEGERVSTVRCLAPHQPLCLHVCHPAGREGKAVSDSLLPPSRDRPDSEHKVCSIHQLVVITPHRIEVVVNINASPNDTSIIRYCTARYPAVVELFELIQLLGRIQISNIQILVACFILIP